MGDNTTLYLIVGAAVVVVLLLVLLLRGRSGRPAAPEQEGSGLADAAAAAVKDVVGEFIDADVHPDLPPAAGEPDPLTRLKGLGPKAAAQLNALGVTRYDQLAALTPAQADALDARMGAFKGRLARDRWIEQAGHLAAGDTAGFETKFGKLGG